MGGTASGDSAPAQLPQVMAITRARATGKPAPRKPKPCDDKYTATDQPRAPVSSAGATAGTTAPTVLPPPPLLSHSDPPVPSQPSRHYRVPNQAG